MSLPSPAEVEHADWPTLKRMCLQLDLNPKGRSGIVRQRLLDYVRRRTRAEPWRPAATHLAPLLLRLGFPEPASRLWDATIRLDAPAPWIGLGAARAAAGDRAEAAKAFDRAAQMGDAVAHLQRAETFAAAGDLPAAVRACEAYLAARPGDLRGLALKARYLARGGWTDEASSVLREAFESHPAAKDLWRGLGSLLLGAARHEAAAEAYREASRADTRDLEALVNRGTALLLAGRSREAIGAYREALEQDGTRADALANLGVAYLASGQPKPAVVNLERAAKHFEHPQILLNVAKAREVARQKQAALEAYRQVLEIRPKDAEAAAAERRLAPAPPRAPAPRRRIRARARPRRGPRKRAGRRISVSRKRRRTRPRRATRRKAPRGRAPRRRKKPAKPRKAAKGTKARTRKRASRPRRKKGPRRKAQ